MSLDRYVVAVVAAALVLFGAALGTSLAFVGAGRDGGEPAVHTMPGGGAMSGTSHEEMPGMDEMEGMDGMMGGHGMGGHGMMGGGSMGGR